MISQITFEKLALEEYSNWASENSKIFVKINKLIKIILRTPFEGEGDPEPLKYELSSYWSRRISGEHRLVYKISDDHLYIASCRGHYR